MAVNTIDAKMLAKMFLAGAKNLESKKEWINELNVFPVPDGDTGTNMTLTIMSAAKDVAAMNAHPVCHDNVEVQRQFIIIQCNCNALGNAVALQQLDKTALHCSAHANDAETLHRHCSRILTNHFIINRKI